MSWWEPTVLFREVSVWMNSVATQTAVIKYLLIEYMQRKMFWYFLAPLSGIANLEWYFRWTTPTIHQTGRAAPGTDTQVSLVFQICSRSIWSEIWIDLKWAGFENHVQEELVAGWLRLGLEQNTAELLVRVSIAKNIWSLKTAKCRVKNLKSFPKGNIISSA